MIKYARHFWVQVYHNIKIWAKEYQLVHLGKIFSWGNISKYAKTSKRVITYSLYITVHSLNLGVNLPEELPVNSLAWRFGPSNKHHWPNLTMCCGNGQANLWSQEDSEGWSNLNGKARGGCDFGKVLTNGLDDTASPNPQTNWDTKLQ